VQKLAHLISAVSRASGVAAAVALAAACLVVCQMVFMRYVIGASTIWQTEFVLYSVVAATLLGSPYVLLTRGHVRVDLVSHLLAPTGRRALEILSSTVGLAFCLVLAWSGGRYFYEAWTEGWVTESVWAPPLWIVLLPLPLGIALLCAQYVVEVVAIVRGDEGHDAADGDTVPDR
jgi:TRAP-type C4-dicarboxylate transport system permease small subunit